MLSVSDKTGIADFAAGLVAHGVELLSTGSTARQLRESGLAVREVSDYTGFPELMDGRLKTLHPKVHGGLLGRRGVDDAAMRERGILPIDMVVVNLYPFGDTVARPDCRFDDAVENIDIGGPAMLRAAAKTTPTSLRSRSRPTTSACSPSWRPTPGAWARPAASRWRARPSRTPPPTMRRSPTTSSLARTPRRTSR